MLAPHRLRHKGAVIQHPSRGGDSTGFLPFPVDA
jgi:hypothetical protein